MQRRKFNRFFEMEESLQTSYEGSVERLSCTIEAIRIILNKVISEDELIAFRNRAENDIRQARNRVAALTTRLDNARLALVARRMRINEERVIFEARKRKVVSRDSLSFDEYMRDPSKYDKRLNALHPFRRLRSINQTLFDERRQICLKVFSMFNFRSVNISGGTSELLGDFMMDLDDSKQVPLLVQFSVPLLILLGSIFDVPLPFPLIFGSLNSSLCLVEPLVPVPSVMHVFKGTCLPVHNAASCCLWIEDMRFIAAIAQGVSLLPETSDPMALLSLTITSPTVIANSFRRSVIEQSVTEGGDWTLLDQL